MDPMAAENSRQFLSGVTLRRPHTPSASNLTGTWMTDEQTTDPATWARQISSTIRFADELDVLLSDPDRILVEVGPGGSLTGSAMRHPKWSGGHRAVRLMRHPIQNADDRDTFLLGLGQLWSAGLPVDWTPRPDPSSTSSPCPVIPLPTNGIGLTPSRSAGRERVADEHLVPAASTNGAAVHRRCLRQRAVANRDGVAAIWMQCLGLGSIGRNANFFDLGGDSLIAIGIATNASNAGLDVSPQDLYGNPTLVTLAAHVDAKYAAGGLAKPA